MNFAKGIDVSRWQDDKSTPQRMNFSMAVDQGTEFVFIKASQSIWADRDILYNWDSARRAGLLRGAYHFLTWDTSPERQAEFMWGLLESDPGELPMVVDYEWWANNPPNASTILRKFVARLKAISGKTPMIYTSDGYWRGDKIAWSLTQECDLWVASYRNEPPPRMPAGWSNWRIWQWTSKGDGWAHGAESRELDLNYFNGTSEELRAWAGTDAPPPPPPAGEYIEARLRSWVYHLNVRPFPGTNNTPIRMLNQGDIIRLEKRPMVGWVKLWGEEGWVHSSYIEVIE